MGIEEDVKLGFKEVVMGGKGWSVKRGWDVEVEGELRLKD